MTPQTPPAPKTGTVIGQGIVEHFRYSQTCNHAYDLGIRAPELIRYAFGLIPAQERAEVTNLVSRSPWALGRITALVKAKRDPTAIPILLLDSRNQDEIEALRVLDQI